ncbi:acylphosphatase [Thermohalobacter berrensis]|uniref:Acylphosphatase n=1 Tax=Thermohalobacter berrensis TaxID=99594 RepID=A0A419T9P8_9FIRM|nr:acylphosphatase [Thermohalobacter berrensis]RKD34193.1 acylphosphatase [Thermohalobacter berrensis]
MVRYHIIVKGLVQGVGFRFYAKQNAIMSNIKGWVKNNIDGTVEIDAQGDKANIDNFVKAIKKGSPFSKVESLDIKELPKLQNYESFEIRY